MSNEFSASSISELEKDERKYNSGSSTIKKISQTNVKIINHFDNIHNFQKKKNFQQSIDITLSYKIRKSQNTGSQIFTNKYGCTIDDQT